MLIPTFTEDMEYEMRTHWLECHQIPLKEIFLIMLVPDPCKEPAMVPALDLPGVSGTQVSLPGVSGLQNNQASCDSTRNHKGRGGKGSKKGGGNRSSKPPSSLSALAKMAARLPPVVSTGTEQTDILELTHEEQEVDDTGESVDTSEKLLSDID